MIGIYHVHEGIEEERLLYTKHAAKCMALGFHSDHVAIGHSNGKMAIYDINNMSKSIFSTKAHDDNGIAAIHGYGNSSSSSSNVGSPLIVTGGIDGVVRLWDPRTRQFVISLTPEHANKRACSSVYIDNPLADAEQCIIAGYGTGDFVLYDIRARRTRLTTYLDKGITDFTLLSYKNGPKKLCATSLLASFDIIDLQETIESNGSIVSFSTECRAKQHERLPCPDLPSSINTCVSHLPTQPHMFVVGKGNGLYTLMSYRDYNINEYGAIIHLTKRFGSCSTVASKRVGCGPVMNIDWYQQQPTIFATCTESMLLVLEIAGV